MRVKVFSTFVVCLVCALSAFGQTVNEKLSSVKVSNAGFEVALAVESQTEIKGVRVSVDILGVNGDVGATLATTANIKPGNNVVKMVLPAAKMVGNGSKDLPWYRLRYSVGDATNTVSFSELVAELFELRVVSADSIVAGMNYRVRVKAVQPFTERPIFGVKLNGNLSIEYIDEDADDLEIKGASTTDKDGLAELEFKIPTRKHLSDSGEIEIEGNKNGLIRSAWEDLQMLVGRRQFLLMMDKPIYQPEETLNVRGVLLFGETGMTVEAGKEVEFRISDQDDTLLFKQKVTTSEYGVAAISWPIPENAKLGNYEIEIRDAADERINRETVKIQRYDLPNFSVEAKSTKPYYLPVDKAAEVEVNANYLFGQPVTKGKVRVVQEADRDWNWQTQKYSITEGEVHEGFTDDAGKFKANFDLTAARDELLANRWEKYTDLQFRAYFTDLSTNKTEQRRFDVRLSKDAIHIYFQQAEFNNRADMPVTAYFTTYYADGTPAACDILVNGSEDEAKNFKEIAHGKSNQRGFGKIEFTRPPNTDRDADLDLLIIANDGNGKSGTLDSEINFEDEDLIRVATDKTIYKKGENVKISLVSSLMSGKVFVEIDRNRSAVETKSVDLVGGRAQLTIPYREEYAGTLLIGASMDDPHDSDEAIAGAKEIIFPEPTGLKVTADFDKAIYKPGEDGKASFSVLNSLGKAEQSAIGVVIFDKAVEERARTDAQFGGTFRNYGEWLGYGQSFAGVNIKDINDLDTTKPISAEMQSIAAAILSKTYYRPNVFSSTSYEYDAATIFKNYFVNQFQLLGTALKARYSENFDHPTDDSSLERIANLAKVDFTTFRDPWGMPYKSEFSVRERDDVVKFLSSGADKVFGTKDDVVAAEYSFAYFPPIGVLIDNAQLEYHKRTGQYIRDQNALFAELGLDKLVDKYGKPYVLIFGWNGRNYTIGIRSNGPDGVYSDRYPTDDFNVWTSMFDYFADSDAVILAVLNKAKSKPLDDMTFLALLKANGIDFSAMRDGGGRPLRLISNKSKRFSDKVTVERVRKYGEETFVDRRIITPVTQEIIDFRIYTDGEDGKAGTWDDRIVANYVFVISEQAKDDAEPKVLIEKVNYSAQAATENWTTGSIGGVVRDATGAVIPSVKITATNETSKATKTVTSNDTGQYLIANLQPGVYSVAAESPGFQKSVFSATPVSAENMTRLDIQLNVGGTEEVVEVSAGSETVDVTASSVATNITSQQIQMLPKGVSLGLLNIASGLTSSDPTSTPKLREYFPETLLWQPELITGTDGKATLKFKTADSITTWRMYAVATTKDGQAGIVTKDVIAFKSFFADLDPPKFLTAGDKIFLPVQIRNYTDSKQNVSVTMANGDWFSILGCGGQVQCDAKNGAMQKIDVAKGDAANAVFGFMAERTIKDGKQRVTAIGKGDSDAIEKKVSVKPDGREIVNINSQYTNGSAQFECDFPANALSKTQRAELKIYPSLMAHVSDSISGLLQRPYGCAEQTISSTYPNLMILKFNGDGNKGIAPATVKQAAKNLASGYERLIGYQAADGGFSYWGGKTESDLALTAYALRFLNDAEDYQSVDETTVEKAEKWLISKQRTDGSWAKIYPFESKEDLTRTQMITTYLARSLAMNVPAATSPAGVALAKALTYLRDRNQEINEPYAMALLGLAASDAKNENVVEEMVERLIPMAIDEAGGVYWKLETNTPFYGWGTAGRIETTALVIQLLMKSPKPNDRTKSLIAKGMLFLLKNKDRYGVWHSTQTTINVLDTFIAAVAGESGKPKVLDILINGKPFKQINVSPDQIEQISINLAEGLAAEKNVVEVKSSDDSPLMSQLVASHYVEWADTYVANRTTNASRSIRLDYKCDNTEVAIMSEVNCHVAAERIGFSGYGMLLAEIGTPPGADVSRESLEKALENDWSLSRYEILPDRIVLYMWAKAGGTKFDFSFRPRYGIDAKTPASVVYDYYNPEAQAMVEPLRFKVGGN